MSPFSTSNGSLPPTVQNLISWLAAPTLQGSQSHPRAVKLEGAVILVPEERSGVMAPVASDDVRVPEIRVRSEDARSDLFLIGDQVVTAKDFVVGCSSDTDALMYRALWKQHDVFRDLDDTFVGIG